MKLKTTMFIALALMLAACEQQSAEPAESDVNLETDEQRYSYGLGMLIGERVLKQYDDVDYDLLIAGMKAQHQNQETQITLQQATDALNQHMEQMFAEQAEANKARGAEFLAANAKKDGVSVTDSGLQYSVITEGDGKKPAVTDQVTVHYRGTLIDGTEFDSSYSRGEPTSFRLNEVIPGWTEGVQLMNVGSKYRFVIPHDLAYGERGAGGSIGPFETLVFEVELLEIGS